MERVRRYLIEPLRRMTLIERLTVLAIVSILIALLVPQVKWVSDGDLDIPVRVFVYEAESGTPLAGAEVTVFRGLPLSRTTTPAQFRDHYADGKPIFERVQNEGKTDDSGTAILNVRCRISASHNRPTPHAHTNWLWVRISHPEYAALILPVRQEAMPSSQLRKEGELFVGVGLMKYERPSGD